VLAEIFRVLTLGGRVGVSGVVAEDHLTPADRAERGSYVGSMAGALTRAEYLDGLTGAGFVHAEVVFTHEAAPGMHGAIVRATKPAAGCCPPAEQQACCQPEDKAECCGTAAPTPVLIRSTKLRDHPREGALLHVTSPRAIHRFGSFARRIRLDAARVCDVGVMIIRQRVG